MLLLYKLFFSFKDGPVVAGILLTFLVEDVLLEHLRS